MVEGSLEGTNICWSYNSITVLCGITMGLHAVSFVYHAVLCSLHWEQSPSPALPEGLFLVLRSAGLCPQHISCVFMQRCLQLLLFLFAWCRFSLLTVSYTEGECFNWQQYNYNCTGHECELYWYNSWYLNLGIM